MKTAQGRRSHTASLLFKMGMPDHRMRVLAGEAIATQFLHWAATAEILTTSSSIGRTEAGWFAPIVGQLPAADDGSSGGSLLS